MKILIFILTCAVLFSQSAKAASIQKQKLYLAQGMKSQLQNSKYKGFKPLTNQLFNKKVRSLFIKSKNESPYAVIGDFNNDKVKDLVVLGKLKHKIILLSILSHNASFKVQAVKTWSKKNFAKDFGSKGLYKYLSLAPKKSLVFKKGATRDAFQIETYMSHATLYYFENNRFKLNKGAVKVKL